MALSILNNISALTAQNQLSITQSNLSKTLSQLSSGSKLNSGADDAAGLSIANGMRANIAALTQSAQNSTNGIGLLQTADGALSQVTALLNRAVTLATEASNAGLTASQTTALNTEFTSILNSIDNIGTETNFNGTQVFTAADITPFLTDGTNGNDFMTNTAMTIGTLSSQTLNIGKAATTTLSLSNQPANNDVIEIGDVTYTFVTAAPAAGTATAGQVQIGTSMAQTLQNLSNAINGGTGAGSAYSTGLVKNTFAQATGQNATSMTLSATTAGVGDGASTGNSVHVDVSGASTVTMAGFAGGVGTADLNSTANAKLALVAVSNAINAVAQLRGNVGADINKLQAATNVMATQVQNLTSADDGIEAADVSKTVADMTKYNILQSTGVAALQQANQAQQSVLKLLQ